MRPRNIKTFMRGSAQKFLNKAIGNNSKPRVINIDMSGANKSGIRSINRELLTVKKIKIRQCKYYKQYSRTRPPKYKEANINRHRLQGPRSSTEGSLSQQNAPLGRDRSRQHY